MKMEMEMTLGNWRLEATGGITDVSCTGSNTYTHIATDLRDTIRNYFTSSVGAVPWQISHVRSSYSSSFVIVSEQIQLSSGGNG